MFRTRITFDDNAIFLDEEHVPFASIEDADVEDGVLVLSIPSGKRRVKLKSSEAMTVLDGVLEGIERAHPRSPYRSLGAVVQGQDPPHARPRRRRTISAGTANLMIGRTFTAG